MGRERDREEEERRAQNEERGIVEKSGERIRDTGGGER